MPKKDEPDNGKVKLYNSNSNIQQIFDEEFKQAISRGENSNLTDSTEPTKFTLINDAFVQSVHDERKKHFTEFVDQDEVLQMNDIEIHAKLIPLVFGDMRGLTEEEIVKRKAKIKEIQDLFSGRNGHTNDHRANMMSYKMHTKLALVHAVRNDNSVVQTDKEVKKMFGGR